ncbi:hypothetical protein [Streptomyces sp. LS1784]|uniref:hypothetical protein n=1 Tax=Streptomyces sp. LS1784 TaxID=2851533 RepID=UPI001CCAA6E9|nr:hypothetical protein [Streptomyces sp. LS1784]
MNGVRGRAVVLAGLLSLVVGCAGGSGENAPVVGYWRSGAGEIEFLKGGELGQVSLLPAVCFKPASDQQEHFKGTWRYERIEGAGRGASAVLTSDSGAVTCERYFRYVKDDAGERLQLDSRDVTEKPFLRQKGHAIGTVVE